MNRQEYFAAQREITKKAIRAETEAARRIRAAARRFVLPLARQFRETGNVLFPKEELAAEIERAIREEGAKPAEAARRLQADMEASLAEKLGIPLPARPEPQQNARSCRENARSPVGSIDVRQGRGWGYGITVSGKTVSAYRRDPETGKVIWDDTPLEYAFRKRADLSSQVWKAVEEQEQKVFDVLRGGAALGRNVRDIAKDLEDFINYPNGGERVIGRWKGMFPDTRKGIRDAYLHQYVQDMGLQWGTPGAHNLLYEKTPGGASRLRAGFRQYLDERMALVKFDDKGRAMRGSKLPDAVKQYAARLGREGLDYRAIRISRTGTAAMLADEQTDIARHSSISRGEMDFVLERGRDAWGCNCEKYAAKSPWKLDDPDLPEIPVHPNCGCVWRPRLKTDEEIMADFRKRMKEDAEAAGEPGEETAGTEQQKTETEDVFEQPIVSAKGIPDDEPARRIERFADYSGVSLDKAVNLENNYLQEQTRKTQREYMSIMSNEEKRTLGTWEGTSGSINSEYDMLRILKTSRDNSLSLLHTHTVDAGFSGVDIGTLCENKSVKDLRARTPDGTDYYAAIGSGKRPARDEVTAKAKAEALKLLALPRYADMKEDDVRWAALIRERNAVLTALYGWIMR